MKSSTTLCIILLIGALIALWEWREFTCTSKGPSDNDGGCFHANYLLNDKATSADSSTQIVEKTRHLSRGISSLVFWRRAMIGATLLVLMFALIPHENPWLSWVLSFIVLYFFFCMIHSYVYEPISQELDANLSLLS